MWPAVARATSGGPGGHSRDENQTVIAFLLCSGTVHPGQNLGKCAQKSPIIVAGACMNFGHASSGPDFDTDLSRNVNLLRLIASAT